MISSNAQFVQCSDALEKKIQAGSEEKAAYDNGGKDVFEYGMKRFVQVCGKSHYIQSASNNVSPYINMTDHAVNFWHMVPSSFEL